MGFVDDEKRPRRGGSVLGRRDRRTDRERCGGTPPGRPVGHVVVIRRVLRRRVGGSGGSDAARAPRVVGGTESLRAGLGEQPP